MNILEVYKKYQIMPQLEEHQLRVAAVAAVILDNLSVVVDRENVVKACLLHDMGNIVKFDWEYTEKYMQGLFDFSSLDYWKKVQQEFFKKYGEGSHNVTMKIVTELGVSERVKELIDCIGFSKAQGNAASEDFAKKICAYSDMRVEPFGIVSLEERFVGLRHRYTKHPEGKTGRDGFEQGLSEIEKQIFSRASIRPEGINELAIKEKLDSLKSYKIK